MSKQPIESKATADIHDSVSLFRALVIFGMLGYGTFFGVSMGLFAHYVIRQSDSLIVLLAVYVVIGWCLGLIVGWENRTTWGARGPKH